MDDISHDAISEVSAKIIHKTTEKCDIDIPDPFCLIILGASGDLTKRKIIPAVYRLFRLNLLPEKCFVLGAARTEMEENDFRDLMRDAVRNALPDEFSDSSWEEIGKRIYYAKLDYSDVTSYKTLREILSPLEKKYNTLGNRILYIATPPAIYETIIQNLGDSGLSQRERGYTHIAIEKPFGRDLESANRLNNILRKSFDEKQIYRMDHYLAKENVQNMLMFRFANSIFEPLWNRRYIDHVQITVSETLGVEHRAGYYEKTGVIRDMFQNHLIQLLALIAMEPPSVFEAERVRDEKVKVFRSIRPFKLERPEDYIVLGQYGKGKIGDKEVVGYRSEPGVASDSVTPTFAALKIFVDNWRWNGIPFYLRSGKRLSTQKAEISIHYKTVPHLMFAQHMKEDIEPNTLILRVQPDEGISLILQTKNPGSRVCLNSVLMNFSYENVFRLGAYERVLLDCIQGDQMLFVRADGIEQTWALFSPLIEKLESGTGISKFPNYAGGSPGPVEASLLIEKDSRKWRAL